ncbi:NfeD family protein [Desulfotruncus alcoholivorax]|uniref:NfeD family protein n=1 Tax=Desulfotruncus alcoholivorax TaxID=265477 RepID=UPI0004045410|nr:NfeD family protein [Desulfotruncus alcoholivorax]
MAAFLTVFGGVGIIGLNYLQLGIIVTLTAALASALLVSFLMFRYILVPLYKAQTSAVSQQDLIGSLATVKLHMHSNSVGRIIYVVNDNTYTAPARSVDGAEIPAGSKVVIVDIEKNVFKVSKI